MASAVYEAIKASRDLPSPTGVALHILRLAQNEESTVEEIAAAVESDPAISSRLLKLVNAPLAGMPRQIASIQLAVALLGVRTVTSLALGFSLVSSHRRGKCSAFDYQSFWSESVARAVAARHVAHHVKKFAPDEAFTCGLLCQIGRLALATAFPEEYAKTLHAVAIDNPEELNGLEQAAFDINHDVLAAEMMTDWHMPAIFCEAVRTQTTVGATDLDPDSRVCLFARVLHLCGSISLVLVRPTVYRDTLSTLVREANSLHVTPYVYHEMFDAISQEWCEVGAILSVRTRLVPPLAEVYSHAQERRAVLEGMEVDPVLESLGGGGYSGRG